MHSTTTLVTFLTTIVCLLQLFQFVELKCTQKHTNREANRNIYRCDNQYFEPGKMQADPENCQCYYHCSYKQQPCYYCCADGQVFNPHLNTCVHVSAYKCTDQPAQFVCPGTGLFANTNHCRKYWDCRNAHLDPVEEACPQDHHWDDAAKVCRKDLELNKFVGC